MTPQAYPEKSSTKIFTKGIKKFLGVFAMSLAFIGSVTAFGDKGNWSGFCGGAGKMMHGSYGYMWGFSPLTWIIKILVIVVLALLATWLWKQINKKK